MDPLVIMVLVVVGGAIGLAVLVGLGDRRAGTRLARQRERRDPIAEGVIKEDDVDQSLDRENVRREERGLDPMGRGDFESMVVADRRTRRRVWLWKGRR
jgi:hypothetical protein